MKHLNLDEVINIGGHRLSLNDLYQLQQANEQLAQAICESFGAEGAGGRVIAGVVLTDNPTDISYTGGWMIKGGLMYKVNPLPTTTKVVGNIIWFVFKKTNTYPAVTYQSGSVYQIHQQREVDIVYSNVLPSGTLHIDYTTPFSVIFKRISDIVTELTAASAYISNFDAVYNDAWVTLGQIDITALFYSGISAVGSSSRLRYKKIGRSVLLQVSLALTSPSPQIFSIKLPTAIANIFDDTGALSTVKQAQVLAVDTRDTVLPCRVYFTPAIVSPATPALINFSRSHTNNATNTVSFMAILELTTP